VHTLSLLSVVRERGACAVYKFVNLLRKLIQAEAASDNATVVDIPNQSAGAPAPAPTPVPAPVVETLPQPGEVVRTPVATTAEGDDYYFNSPACSIKIFLTILRILLFKNYFLNYII